MSGPPGEVLAEERRFYAAQRESLLRAYEGKYVLIKGSELVGAFDTPNAAYEEGLRRFGNVAMLIVQVRRDQPTSQVPALTLGLIRASIP